MRPGHHLSLSLSADLWHELLRTALPLTVASGEVSLAGAARGAWQALDVEGRVAGLLEDKRAPAPLQRVSRAARAAWEETRPGVVAALAELVAVEGTWRVDIDEVGTDLSYGPQKVHADAFLRGVAEGTITLLRANVSRPFRVEVRLGASLSLGRIRYAPGREAVIANLQDLALHLGDHAALQLVSRALAGVVGPRLESTEPMEILRREQIEGIVRPMGEGLGTAMGVDDLQLDVDEHEMILRVRFGFAQGPARGAAGASRRALADRRGDA